MKTMILTSLLLSGLTAHAAPIHFKNCKSAVVTEVFETCPDGENGSQIPCSSKQTLWGNVNAEMTIDSEKQTASANVVYTSVEGKVSKSATKCVLGDDKWMSCETTKKVSQLGKLSIDFNINGIDDAKSIFFVDIFAEGGNVPVGGFQNTEMDCEK